MRPRAERIAEDKREAVVGLVERLTAQVQSVKDCVATELHGSKELADLRAVRAEMKRSGLDDELAELNTLVRGLCVFVGIKLADLLGAEE